MPNPADLPWGPILGGVVLLYLAYGKYAELRFRRTAVTVKAEVKKITPRRHFTSYLFGYTHAGVARLDEHRGPPAVPQFELGQMVEILVDPRSPAPDDVAGESDRPPHADRPTGTCTPAGAPLFGFWDAFYVLAAAAAIALPFVKK